MKVVSLNTWGGKGGLEGLLAFLKEHDDVDVFCLQEVWSGNEDMVGVVAGSAVLEGVSPRLLYEIEAALPGYRMLYRPYFRGAYGLAMFVKEGHEVLAEGETYIYREPGFISEVNPGDHARILQYATLRTPEGPRTIINLHGIWQPMSDKEIAVSGGKGDNADRLEQSARILAFTETLDHPFVLVGDFNLLPETESVAMLERSGLRNLIREFGISSTRTSHYRYKETNPFADYAFVSAGIEVEDFRVLPDEVSDHAPLYLAFS